MGLVLPLDILADVSYVLIEPFVDTTLGTAVGAPGSVTVSPPVMLGIYVGAVLVIGRGTPNVESVTVTAVTSTTFTATFANTHLAADAVNGATFPSGLFSQTEMLEYLYHSENELLVKIRPTYGSATQALSVATRVYPQPASAIRIERVSSTKKAWTNTSMLTLDLDNSNWQSDHASDDPKAWFQDEIGLDNFGIWPLVDIGGLVAQLWYSVKEITNPLTFLTPFVLPDIFTMYLKYGVLNRAFSKDGEQRDDLRAKFCQKKLDFGVMLARMFLLASETLAAEMEADQQQASKFSPMLVNQ
jgi:uncharacterized protein DUF6682